MSEQKHDIGNLIKDKFEGSKIEPSEDLWNKIETTLDGKQRRRKFLLFSLFGGLAVLLVSILVVNGPFKKNPTNTSDKEKSTVVVDKKNTTPLNEDKSLLITDTYNEDTLGQNEKQDTLGKVPAYTNHRQPQEGSTLSISHQGKLSEVPQLSKENTQRNPDYIKDSIKGFIDPTDAAPIGKVKGSVKNPSKDKMGLNVTRENTKQKKDAQQTEKEEKLDSFATTKTAYYYYNSSQNIEIKTENKKVIDSILESSKTNFEKDMNADGESPGMEGNELNKHSRTSNKALQNSDSPSYLEEQVDGTSKNDSVQTHLKKGGFKTAIKEEIQDSLGLQNQNDERSPWGVRVLGGPTYYNIPRNKSIIGTGLENRKKNGEFNFNYGVELNRKLNERMSLSAGVMQTKLSYEIDNIPTSTAGEVFGLFSLQGLKVNNPVTSDTIFFRDSTAVKLKQQIEYIEVPITLDYTILGKEKIGLNILGGFSTYFLTNNEVFIENESGDSILLGMAENLSKTNFSFNVGLGFYGALTRNLYAEIRPMYKYHFNTQNIQSLGSTSYSLGINFGLRYVFNNRKRQDSKDAPQ
ncbi:MAG: hypothetical protein Aureis2KO_07480 [Aureisphaera sp.]